MDFVDQALSDLRQESCVFCHVTATEPWQIQKGQSQTAPFYIVLSGCVQVAVDGEVHKLAAGDFLVLPQGVAHHVQGCASDGAEAIPLLTLFQQQGIGPWAPGMRLRALRFTYGGGGEAAEILIGLFYFGNPRQHPLLTALPPALVLRTNKQSQISSGQSSMAAIQKELTAAESGWNFAVARLADLLFIQALRLYLGTVQHAAQGWLRGMIDPVISPALTAIHKSPEKGWTLEMLARVAGSSRATFAQRFSNVMGVGAMAYLAAWRMNVAAGLLREGTCSVAEVADRVGYSADGFSAAFKGWSGATPRDYRAREGWLLKQQTATA